MSDLSPFFAVAVVAVALLSSHLLNVLTGAEHSKSKFEALDGLRGMLAILVFAHHALLWFFYVRTGKMTVPPSNFYTNIGQGSVALFFMVTGFLFYRKLDASVGPGSNWTRIYVSRALRITPLYLFAFLMALVVAGVLSKWAVPELTPNFLKNLFGWAVFHFFGGNEINGIEVGKMLGVVWTLKYEWIFYALLPALALLMRAVRPVFFVSLAAVLAVLCIFQMYFYAAFFGGFLAAVVIKSDRFRKFCEGKPATVLVITLLAGVCFGLPSSYSLPALLLLTMAFSLIAGGNSIAGLLVIKAAKNLGEMSYSIYLLHLFFLYGIFELAFGLQSAKALSPLAHWTVVFVCTPVLVSVCYLTCSTSKNPQCVMSTKLQIASNGFFGELGSPR